MKGMIVGISLLAVVLVLGQASLDQPAPTYGVSPFPGFVPDAATAKQMAIPVIRRLLGDRAVQGLEYDVKPNGKSWIVVGSHKRRAVEGPVGQDVAAGREPVLTIDKMSGAMSFRVR